MIHYKDAGVRGRVRNAEIPDLVRQRVAFDTEQHRMFAFNDALGNYAVYSYDKPVLTISPQGEIRSTKGYIYKGHREVLRPFLEGGNT